jgi:hypothetical protein
MLSYDISVDISCANSSSLFCSLNLISQSNVAAPNNLAAQQFLSLNVSPSLCSISEQQYSNYPSKKLDRSKRNN